MTTRRLNKLNQRLLAAPALGALIAFGAVACSSDNSAQLNSWAAGLCDTAKGPIAQSRAALADTGKVNLGEAPADLQKRLSTDLGTLATTNQQLADALDKAGAPKIDNGASLQKSAIDELKQAAQGYQDVQKKLATLPSGDQARFADGLRSIGDQVQQLSQQSTDALKKLQSGDLGAAIVKQPGCATGQTPGQTQSQAPTPSAAQSGGTSAAASAPASGSAPAAAPSPAASTGAATSPSPSTG